MLLCNKLQTPVYFSDKIYNPTRESLMFTNVWDHKINLYEQFSFTFQEAIFLPDKHLRLCNEGSIAYPPLSWHSLGNTGQVILLMTIVNRHQLCTALFPARKSPIELRQISSSQVNQGQTKWSWNDMKEIYFKTFPRY